MRLQSLPALYLLLASFSLAVTPSSLHSQPSVANEPAEPPSSATAANSSASMSESSLLNSAASPGSARLTTTLQVESSLKNLNGVLNHDRVTGNRPDEAHVLGAMASCYNALHQQQKAVETYQSELDIWRELGDKEGEGTTRAHIGDVYREWGFPDQAIHFYRDVLKIYPNSADNAIVAAVLNNLGLAYFALHDKKKSLEYLDRALAGFRARHDRQGEALTLTNLGSTYGFLVNDPHRALDYFQEALTKLELVNDRSTEATALELMGGIWIKLQKPDLAANTFKRSLFLFSRLGDAQGEASVRKQLRIMGVLEDRASNN